MHVRVLGHVEVAIDGVCVDLGGPKQRTLLGLLIAADGRVVSVERLIDQMWGDDPPAKVLSSLQAYVAHLRRGLEPGRGRRQPAGILVTRPPGYALQLIDQDLDARRFADLVAEARQVRHQPVRAEGLLGEALDLWRGDAYSDVAAVSGALRAEAARLDELRLDATEELWGSRIDRGEAARAVGELEQLVATHPFRERAWRLLALALYRSSRQGDALAVLQRARSHLAEELGIDPGTELRELEVAVLRQDPILSITTEEGARRELPVERPDLVGRDLELGLASDALDAARQGAGRVVVVSGEPGIGKTRLAKAIAAMAHQRGMRVGWGGWEADEAPPLSGWHQLVGDLLGDTEILQQEAPDVDAASSTFRLGNALVDVLKDGPPSMLVLDDLHWADPDSLRLLRRCASAVGGLPVTLVVTSREPAADVGPGLVDSLATLARLDPVRIPLAGLHTREIAAAVHEQTGVAVTDEVASAIRDRTEGNPFFVTELVRLLVAEGALADPTAASWRSVPGGVRDVVRQRLVQRSERQIDALVMGAVIGRSFDLDVLAAATALADDELDDAIEAGLVSGLIEEDGVGRYRFAHAVVRDAVYDLLPAIAQMRAHARAGQALERMRFGRTKAYAVELAEHFRLAGPTHVRAAWSFTAKAAQSAVERSAPDQAARLYGVAAELLETDPSASADERESILSGLGRALCRTGRPTEAWTPLRGAGESALARGDAVHAARTLLTITEQAVWTWRTHPLVDDRAIAMWESVLAALPESEVVLGAQVRVALAVELLYRPDAADYATRLVDGAVLSARRSNRQGELMKVLHLAHLALQRPDLLERRIPIGDELVALALRLDTQEGLAAALCRRATDRAESARWEDACADMARAQELAARHQVAPILVITGWALALARQASGDFTGAERAINEIEELQSTISMSGVGIGLCQMATIRMTQGRLVELEPALRRAAQQSPNFRDLHALALIDAGRADEARSIVGAWEEREPLPWDFLWLGLTTIRARLWSSLGDAAAMSDLRRQLEPFSERLAVGGMSAVFLGAVGHTVGELALLTGDESASVILLKSALDTHQRLGFLPFARATESLLSRLGS